MRNILILLSYGVIFLTGAASTGDARNHRLFRFDFAASFLLSSSKT
jgi:hypothetical protein